MSPCDCSKDGGIRLVISDVPGGRAPNGYQLLDGSIKGGCEPRLPGHLMDGVMATVAPRPWRNCATGRRRITIVKTLDASAFIEMAGVRWARFIQQNELIAVDPEAKSWHRWARKIAGKTDAPHRGDHTVKAARARKVYARFHPSHHSARGRTNRCGDQLRRHPRKKHAGANPVRLTRKAELNRRPGRAQRGQNSTGRKARKRGCGRKVSEMDLVPGRRKIHAASCRRARRVGAPSAASKKKNQCHLDVRLIPRRTENLAGKEGEWRGTLSADLEYQAPTFWSLAFGPPARAARGYYDAWHNRWQFRHGAAAAADQAGPGAVAGRRAKKLLCHGLGRANCARKLTKIVDSGRRLARRGGIINSGGHTLSTPRADASRRPAVTGCRAQEVGSGSRSEGAAKRELIFATRGTGGKQQAGGRTARHHPRYTCATKLQQLKGGRDSAFRALSGFPSRNGALIDIEAACKFNRSFRNGAQCRRRASGIRPRACGDSSLSPRIFAIYMKTLDRWRRDHAEPRTTGLAKCPTKAREQSVELTRVHAEVQKGGGLELSRHDRGSEHR